MTSARAAAPSTPPADPRPDPRLPALLASALAPRAARLAVDARHEGALRLFNGFSEGFPGLVVDLYGATLVLHNQAEPAPAGDAAVAEALAFYQEACPWLTAVVVKARHAADQEERHGRLLLGDRPAAWVREDGLRYALDILGGHDCGLYLDTRGLRAWARAALDGRTVLNCFAYTGSLGVAALAGGAAQVLQLDRSRAALNVAKTSCTLNGLPIRRPDFLAGDFWDLTARLRRDNRTFDGVILDPPFFAGGARSKVDLADGGLALMNKVRPLVADGGYLAVVNNAVYVSGQAFTAALERVCADGYLRLERRIDVPDDVAGYPETRVSVGVSDPAPFNHSTKIAVLSVRRKDARAGSPAVPPPDAEAGAPD
jgi:23S rRNA (cytosine1962-C5)-methyltransferase